MVSLHILGWPGTHHVDQDGLRLTTISLASASEVLGRQACATTLLQLGFPLSTPIPALYFALNIHASIYFKPFLIDPSLALKIK